MNGFGRAFRVSLFGESHGAAVGVVLDGVPPGLPLKEEDFGADLARRRTGSAGTSARRESDVPRILSGVVDGHATGTPIAIAFENTDVRSADYSGLASVPRPGHADWTWSVKTGGFRDIRGGGHSSARLTVGLVAAGVVARKILAPAVIRASLLEVGGERDVAVAVQAAMAEKDSVGGIVGCQVEGLPAGLGEPWFDSAESLLAHVLFAIPSVKGVEFGEGFQGARMRGSEFNDPIVDSSGHTSSNHAGGINGGITNGNPLSFRVALRPAPTIGKEQTSWDFEAGEMRMMSLGGRHDVCPALRSPVIVEAAAAVVLADLLLLSWAGAPWEL